ncbi:Aste57867_12800 [Aphanomyces stellatus]|uniref:Aste57867_12800 protein n=1 Tax=Aphanomyces stellatus TaxID=120398 RepID=A0A485KWI2_9STRA|nr:hypothetical protein As57867_012752 [Aphanomyces stellatus]VFT89649.1 Aste57867_12800 [Aphanomyces stellatus]
MSTEPPPKRPRLMPPTDVLVKIALSLDDVVTFFSFLDAMGDHRGALEPLWQLGLTTNHKDLWPQLCLSWPLMRDPVSRALVKAILHLYSTVVVRNIDNVAWLHEHLRPPIKVEWQDSTRKSRPSEWLDQWIQLPITTMRLWCSIDRTSSSSSNPSIEACLGRLSTLESLTLQNQFSLQTLFAWAAQPTSKLVDLDVNDSGVDNALDASTVRDAIQWLETHPVRTFRLCALPFHQSVDWKLRTHFYSAMFQQPTKELYLHFFGYNPWTASDMVFYPFSMESLTIQGGSIAPRDLVRFADMLAQSSSLTRLSLKSVELANGWTSPQDSTDAFAYFLDKVSSIHTLVVDWCSVNELDWRQLGPVLQRSSVRNLSLTQNRLDQEAIYHIAKGLQGNNTIQVVDLTDNDVKLGVYDVKVLLDCNLYRSVPLETLRVRGRRSSTKNTQMLAMAEERGINLILSDE